MRKGKLSRNGRSRRSGYGRRSSRTRGHRRERPSAQSGNERERIAIESGYLVLLDQFMLANPQFISKLGKLLDADPAQKDQLVQDYGGCVVELQPGTYRIDRDPYAFSIIVHPEGAPGDIAVDKATQPLGHVFIDTRCLAMVDRELLDDSGLLERYQQLWFSGQDKACRDLLRDNGGAVRYGFQRYGDELGIYKVPGQNIVCLWPDVAEEIKAA